MTNKCWILTVLENRELSALQICETINDASNGQIKLNVARLYPVLYEIEQQNLIQSRWSNKRPKKRMGLRRLYYSLTQSGEKYLSSVQQNNQEKELCQQI